MAKYTDTGAPQERDYQPILDAQMAQLDLTISGGDSADAKALGILAVNITFIIYSLQSLMDRTPVLLVPLFICLVASAVCNVIGFGGGEYIGPGIELKDHPEYFSLTAAELVLQRISDVGLAISLNSGQNDRKLRWLRRSFILSAIAVLCVAGCIIKV
jgi:hypothetical protein